MTCKTTWTHSSFSVLNSSSSFYSNCDRGLGLGLGLESEGLGLSLGLDTYGLGLGLVLEGSDSKSFKTSCVCRCVISVLLFVIKKTFARCKFAIFS